MATVKTLLITLLILIAAGVIFIYSGIYNVAATAGHWPVTRWILETTQVNSVEARKDGIVAPPTLANQQRVARGAKSYGSMCQVCHLGPGVKPTPVHNGLTPPPPALSEVASHHSPEYLFWATKHGIKMTGMPAWGESHTDEELWDLVAFVQKLPELTAQEYAMLTRSEQGHQH
jgi:mono/diheme cytochrome c family protein